MAKPTTKAKTKLFVSQFQGENVRLTLADGSVANIGDEPKPLPERFWRAALKGGAMEADGKPMTSAERKKAVAASPDNDEGDGDTLIERIVAKIGEIFDGDPDSPRFADALTAQDVPRTDWLSGELGANISASQRDEAMALFNLRQEESEGDEEGEEEQE